MDYIPLATRDFKLAVCQACRPLPPEIIREHIYPYIWEDSVCPPAPNRNKTARGIIDRLKAKAKIF